MDVYVGIDVGKDVLDVAVLRVSGEVKHFKTTNDEAGYQELHVQLEALPCQVVFEATGPYHRQLQKVLQNAAIAVSVVNPRQALNYAKSQNRRNKTDKVDALLLAQFGLAISRMGSAQLRHILYMPAVCSSRWNPLVKDFYEQLVGRGKPKMVALVAAMAKLLRIAYGVLKAGKPFNPNLGT